METGVKHRPDVSLAHKQILQLAFLQLTLDNSNLQEKSKKVWVIGSSRYREMETNDENKGNKTTTNMYYMFLV